MAIGFQPARTISVAEFNKIKLDTDVRVIIKPGDTFSVTVKVAKGITITPKVVDEQLVISQHGHSKDSAWWQRLINSLEKDEPLTAGIVTVCVPKNRHLQSIEQSFASRDLQMENVQFDNGLELHGQLKLDQVTAPTIRIDAEDDDVTISNSKFLDGASSIKSIDGDFALSYVHFQQLTDFKLKDGDVSFDHVTVDDRQTKVITEDGDLTFDGSTFDALRIGTEDGDIVFSSMKIKTAFKINTNDGDVKGLLSPDDDVNIITSTNDGDVVISANNDENAEVEYYIVTYDGDIIIK